MIDAAKKSQPQTDGRPIAAGMNPTIARRSALRVSGENGADADDFSPTPVFAMGDPNQWRLTKKLGGRRIHDGHRLSTR